MSEKAKKKAVLFEFNNGSLGIGAICAVIGDGAAQRFLHVYWSR